MDKIATSRYQLERDRGIRRGARGLLAAAVTTSSFLAVAISFTASGLLSLGRALSHQPPPAAAFVLNTGIALFLLVSATFVYGVVRDRRWLRHAFIAWAVAGGLLFASLAAFVGPGATGFLVLFGGAAVAVGLLVRWVLGWLAPPVA